LKDKVSRLVQRQIERLAGWRSLRQRRVLARYFAGRMLTATGLWRFVVLKRRDFVLRFYPSAMSISEWTAPGERQDEEDFFRNYLRPGDNVMDVGANVGTLTLVASRAVGPNGSVVALEPHPRIYGFLLGNLALNKVRNVVTHNVAVGAAKGQVWLTSTTSDDQNSVTTQPGGVQVQVVPLDEVIATGDEIALLKIDVEGYERHVLAGATRTLRRTNCVYFESSDQAFARFGYGVAEVTGLLRDAGFEIFRFGPTGTIESFGANDSSPRCENLLAVRDAKSFGKRLGVQL